MRIYGPADLITAASTVRQDLNAGTEQVREILELVPRVIAMVGRAESLLNQAEGARARTDDLVARAELTRAQVDLVATRAEALVERSEALLAPMEQLAPEAMPIAEQLVQAIDPDEIQAVNGLIDRLPSVLGQVDHIGPDVNRILAAVTDLSVAMQGLPGLSALKRCGERKADEDETAADPYLGSDPRPISVMYLRLRGARSLLAQSFP